MKEIIIVVLHYQVQLLSNQNETHVYILKWNYLKPCDFPLRSFPSIFMIVSILVANKSEQLVMLVSV